MGFIPFSYWGYGCNDFLPTGSLVFYYNANDQNSYDKLFTGSTTNTNTGIINLANQGTNLGIVVNGSYNNTYYGINTLSAGYIDNNIPLTLFDGAQQGTILVKGYIPPLLTAQDKYLLINTQNSNEGIRAFGTINTTTKGQFTFSRGVLDLNGLPTASMYNTEGVGMIALTKQVGQGFGVLSTSSDNFTAKYSGSVLINDFDWIFTNLGYFQAAAYWNRKLSDSELISASAAFNCNGQPQGYNATTASSYSNLFRFYGGTVGTTAYYLAPNETTLTRRPIAINEVYYACVSNSGSRLNTTGSATTVTDLGPCPTASIYPNVNLLLVAGGGGGGYGGELGAGGGAGGFLTSSLSLSSSITYSIVIGNGGAQNTNGENTTGFSLTAIGGGRGGYGSGSFKDGANGGSGGGANGGFNTSGAIVGIGTVGQGNDGGRRTAPSWPGGGGGAYASPGQSTSVTTQYGGEGKYYYFTGNIYAGGGAASQTDYSNPITTPYPGGLGGGGNGAAYSTAPSITASAGQPNTGGGGGGGTQWFGQNAAGSGGSGIVIVSYSGSTPQATGGTITSGSGIIIHTFTSSGNFIT